MRLAAIAGAAASLLSLAGGAAGQEDMRAAQPGYVHVGGNDTIEVFVHVDSMRRDGQLREVWELRNRADPLYVGDTPYLSYLVLDRFDCAGRRSGMVHTAGYALREHQGEIRLPGQHQQRSRDEAFASGIGG